MKREIVRIFKSPKKNEAYLYTRKSQPLDELPESLLAVFGTPELVMDMLLTPEKKLARAEADKVLEALETQGFYLQMPPPKEDYMLDLYREKARSDHG